MPGLVRRVGERSGRCSGNVRTLTAQRITACLESLTSARNETVIAMTAILAHARVSTTGQDVDALTAAGVEAGRVFTDKLSGSAQAARPGLAAILDYARAGDTVVVVAIDRLGRSVAEVTRTIADLGEQRIILRALREGIDTATPAHRGRRDHGNHRGA